MSKVIKIPIRYTYHLQLSNRRGINLTHLQYAQLKATEIVVDGRTENKKHGQYKVIQQNCVLNRALFFKCTAFTECIDDFGAKEIVVLVLDRFRNYVHPDVAHELRSRLGDMIRKYGKAA